MTEPVSYINYHTDYDTVSNSLFLERKLGLVENLRNEFPQIWELYKQLKSLDWDENEIDITSCRAEFLSLPEEITQLMIRTLAWQFEADSSAAHIAPLMLPFVSCTEMAVYLTQLSGNELLHSLAYKVIVESSFDNPNEFLDELMSIKESFQRLDVVKSVFDETHLVAHRYALGLEKDELLVRKTIFKFWVTALALERIQFMSSFAITFGLAENGFFVPIAKLVQKICTDEFQVHVEADKAILRNEMALESNFPAYLEALDDIAAIVKEITDSELTWLDYLFGDKEEIAGNRKDKVREFVLYSATEVYSFLNIESPFPAVKENPLPYMNKWIVIDSNQSSPQEESVANYLLGGFVDDSKDVQVDAYGLKFTA